jgi:hypothetical protein
VDRDTTFELLSRIGLVLLGVCVLTPAIGELALRGGIALGSDRLRDPGLYADPYADDDYWKLQHRWGFKDNLQQAGTVHPSLGWAPRVTERNPLGILVELPYEVDFAEECILFFGDSFVAGRGPLPERLPQQLGDLVDVPVYNYGVAGYGVDQIFLRFREAHPHFERPTILFGILTTDLDRSLLSIRTGQKPRFELRDDALELVGLPIHPDPRAFLALHPPGVRSYFAALALRQARLWAGGGDGTEIAYRRDEKQELNRRLLEATVDEAARRELPLLFVLFYDAYDLEKSGWREAFLRAEMERLGAAYLDTKELMVRRAAERSVPWADFYRVTDAHLSAFGNRAIAEALALEWKRGRLAQRSLHTD